MIALGTLAVLLGVLSAYHANTFDPSDYNSVPEARKQLDEQIALIESLGLSLHGVMLFSAGLTLTVGAVLGALGFGVRAGRLVPVVLSIMLVAVLLLFLALGALATLFQGAVTGSPVLLAQSCVPVLMLAAIVVLLVWLIRAARAAPHLTYARQVMEYQASQYQQIQQYYQQQNSGAGVQQAAPPPGTGGYHQYPAAPTTMPGASQPQQTPTQAPPDTGDKSDGPPAQG